jgi:hypothetical protein
LLPSSENRFAVFSARTYDAIIADNLVSFIAIFPYLILKQSKTIKNTGANSAFLTIISRRNRSCNLFSYTGVFFHPCEKMRKNYGDAAKSRQERIVFFALVVYDCDNYRQEGGNADKSNQMFCRGSGAQQRYKGGKGAVCHTVRRIAGHFSIGAGT